MSQLLVVDERNCHLLLSSNQSVELLCASSGAGLGGVQLSLANCVHDFCIRGDLCKFWWSSIAEPPSDAKLRQNLAR